MTHLLAQGGGGNSWFSPGVIKSILVFGFILLSLLANVVKKVREKNAERAAALAVHRRRDDVLRTGRDESGAYVDAPRASIPEAPPTVATVSNPKQQMLALAEERRRQLAAMMARAAQANRSSGTPPAVQAPARSRTVAATPAQPRPVNQRQLAEHERRRHSDQQSAAKRAAQAARRRDQPSASEVTPTALQQPMHIAASMSRPAVAPIDRAAGANFPIGAVARGTAGRSGIFAGASIAELRRAIVLSEVLNAPLSLRPDGERSL